MCAGLGVLMLAFSVQGSAVHPRGLTTSLLAVSGMFLFRASFALSLGPLPHVMTSELFPQEVRAAGRLRVVGGELVVELAGGAVLSRAACVAVHTPRRTWEHGDDLRWVRGVLLTWVRFSVVDVARNQGNLTGESRSSAGHRAHCVLPSPASRQAWMKRPAHAPSRTALGVTGSGGGGNCQHVRSWSSCVLTAFLLWLCSSSPRV